MGEVGGTEKVRRGEANLRTGKTSVYVFWVFLGTASLIDPSCVMAQAAPGPLAPTASQSQPQAPPPEPPTARSKEPAVQPRTTLAGSWKLNHDDSDDPQQKVRAAERQSGGNAGSDRDDGYPGGGYPGGYPGRYPGGGYPGNGPMGGGYPYPGDGGPYGVPRGGGKDIAGNPKMQSLIHPSESLNIDLKNPEVDVTDDQFRKLTLYTDGRQLQKQTDENHQEMAAHWNGSQLVSDEKSPLGGKMSRTFELSADGRRFYETLHIDNGRSKTPMVNRYAYDAASSDAHSVQESDPNRPVLKRHSDDSSS